MRNFDSWLDSFCESIANYKYYINFDTVYANTDKFKVELNILNSLVGSTDIENDFKRLVEKYPECIKVIPLLLAKRENEIFCMDSCGAFVYNFNNKLLSPEQYIYFMKETGLFDLISGKIISNLYDYALGVNTGLDSNGRKNRGGHLMEDLCEEYVKAIGLPYGKEVCISSVEKETGLNLSSISKNGDVTKRFDFVVYGKQSTYAIECNFYASGGSKLNETARSYKNIALESHKINGFTFIWITDGQGWKSAKHNLRETFDVLTTMYNIKDLKEGALNNLR